VPRELKPLDISNLPELVRIAEEVQSTQQPRVLRRRSEDVAVIVPVTGSPSTVTDGEPAGHTQDDASVQDAEAIWANYDPQRVKRALRASSGSLSGVDREALLRDIHEAREQDSSGRPS
jgi:hypothetical protein